MISRLLTSLLRERLSTYPAVALLGPRQCGKTTLARSMRGEYFDLEQPQEQLRLDLLWPRIETSKNLVILDEAQAWPELFPRLRSVIDRDRKRKGRFLLLGSVSPALTQHISESLAGRMSLCELSPLGLKELPQQKADLLWMFGGYPEGGILASKRYPSWQQDYLTLLAQRDLPQWGLPAKPFVTERFFRMLAASHGQILNATQLGASLGVSYHTVQSYLEYLRGAFLIRVLEPYHAKLNRRLVKSPKIYWRDSGLLHALLGLKAKGDLLSQPWVGQSWEGWVIEQIFSFFGSKNPSFDATYFRSSDGLEADLILQFSNRIKFVIEMKLSSSPSLRDFDALHQVASLIQGTHLALISKTKDIQDRSHKFSGDLAHFLDWAWSFISSS